MRAVVAVSGGMDSATLLGVFAEQGAEIICCSFKYPSKHNRYELEAAAKIIDFYAAHGVNVSSLFIDVSPIFKNARSSLIIGGGEIPNGNYQESSMSKTVVPGRNLIFASIMSSIAESSGAELIALGVHAGDHFIYPDCRPDFIESLSDTIRHSTEGKVQVSTPFLNFDKSQVLAHGLAQKIAVPYHLTRTCYKAQGTACGVCGSCNERLEAFAKINMDDPIEYEKKEAPK
ncbi:MAG: 7-cyano-7-deazaguanine synthase QueC [Limnochordia bacterium]|nr:7-cyano-7-deazaguanine synthase QueC [Limnochordia bacterium]